LATVANDDGSLNQVFGRDYQVFGFIGGYTKVTAAINTTDATTTFTGNVTANTVTAPRDKGRKNGRTARV
jgi:hypothetical protein